MLAFAGVVLVVMLPGRPAPEPLHREPTVQSSLAPTTLAPEGSVARLQQLTWTGVVGSDRYRVALFDTAGRVLWEATVSDTTALVPASVALSRIVKPLCPAAGSHSTATECRIAGAGFSAASRPTNQTAAIPPIR